MTNWEYNYLLADLRYACSQYVTDYVININNGLNNNITRYTVYLLMLFLDIIERYDIVHTELNDLDADGMLVIQEAINKILNKQYTYEYN